MKSIAYWWCTRVVWPVAGAAWGAWIGFQGVFQHSVPDMNRDTAAPIFVWGFFVLLAGIGLVIGAASAIAIGRSTEWLLRRMGIGTIAALSVATLVNVLALWQTADALQARYPGFRAGRAEESHRGKATGTIAPADPGSYQKPCSAPPPTDPRARASWEAECR